MPARAVCEAAAFLPLAIRNGGYAVVPGEDSRGSSKAQVLSSSSAVCYEPIGGLGIGGGRLVWLLGLQGAVGFQPGVQGLFENILHRVGRLAGELAFQRRPFEGGGILGTY